MNDNPLAIHRRGKVQHQGPEKKYEEKVKAVLLELRCRTVKLHGSEYQAGLPDLLVLTPNGAIRLIEIKWADKDPELVGDLFLMLKGRQKSLIPLWGRAGAPMYILCGCRSGKHFAIHAGSSALECELPSGDRLLRIVLKTEVLYAGIR